MASFRTGRVVRVVEERPRLTILEVDADEVGRVEAVLFADMTGPASSGDRVVVNTTGLELGLGTGGRGFVLWNLDGSAPNTEGRGHIVKMRYTPWQTEVDAVEAQESPHHDALSEARTIAGLPVVACGLHSQIGAVAAGIRVHAPDARIGYLMTDAAALPLALSDLVAQLRQAGLVDVTATSGHAFGGDLEVVNVFSGLVAMKVVADVDAAIVALGPGVVGTGTALGFSAIEQGQVLDAASGLGGRGIACLRVNWSEARPRHRGVSHHSLTSLTAATQARCIVAVPDLERTPDILRALGEAGVAERHEIVIEDPTPALALLTETGIEVTSMGRGLAAIPELFAAAAAAGSVAGRLVPS